MKFIYYTVSLNLVQRLTLNDYHGHQTWNRMCRQNGMCVNRNERGIRTRIRPQMYIGNINIVKKSGKITMISVYYVTVIPTLSQNVIWVPNMLNKA